MADFRETLRIFKPKSMCLPFYTIVWKQEDLATGDKKIEIHEMQFLGECCDRIEKFSPSERIAKLAIISFLKTDKYYASDEY